MNVRSYTSDSAIALSVQEAKRAVGHQVTEPIVISSDEDESPASPSKPIKRNEAPADSSQIITSEGTNQFLSERAQLEAARLARLNARNAAPTTEKSNNDTSASSPTQAKHKQKRKRAATTRGRDPDDPFVSSASDSDSDVIALPKNKKQKFSVNVSSNRNANASSSSSSRTANEESEPMYWSGELRQTGNMYVDPEKDTRPVFRLHDILGNVCNTKHSFFSPFLIPL
jgi:tyrosyl-DNA phosphodiesterase-1